MINIYTVKFLAALLFVSILITPFLSIPKVNASDLGVTLTREYSGLSPFDTSAGLGQDTSSADNILRVNDEMSFAVSYSANTTNANNLVLTFKHDQGASWVGVPVQCLSGSNIYASSGSLYPDSLVCNLGSVSAGSTFNITGIRSKAKFDSHNSQTISTTVTATADSSLPVISNLISTSITGLLDYNLNIGLVSQRYKLDSDGITGGIELKIISALIPRYPLQYPYGSEALPINTTYKVETSGISPNTKFQSIENCSGCNAVQLSAGGDVTVNYTDRPVYNSFTYLYVWVPLSDIPDTGQNTGSRTISILGKNLVLGLTPSGLINNTTGIESNLDDNIFNGTITTSKSGYSPQKNAVYGVPWYQFPEVSETFNSQITFYNNGTSQILNTIMCDVIDNTTQRLVVPIVGEIGFNLAGIILQYGRSNGTNIKNQTCNDADANLETWSSSPTEGSNMVRAVIPVMNPGTFILSPRIEPRLTFNGGPNNGQNIPGGTRLEDCQAVRYNIGSGDRWALDNFNGFCTYTTFKPVILRVLKQANNLSNGQQLPGEGFQNQQYFVGDVVAGNIIEWKLSTGTIISKIKNTTLVQFVDTLPSSMNYIPGSASLNPSTVVTNGDGTTTIKWDVQITNLTYGNNAPTITYQSEVKLNAPAGISTNLVELTSPDAPDVVASRLRVNVLEGTGFAINNNTTTPIIDPNGQIEYVLNYYNASGTNLTSTELINVLPFNGDSRNPQTDYTGTAIFDSIVVNNSEQIEYTKKSPSLINANPSDSSNLIGGSTTWCAGITGGSCPANNQEITAFRITGGLLNTGTAVRSVKYKINTDGNLDSNTYTNVVAGKAQGLPLTVFSNNSKVIVNETSISGYVFKDQNEDGYWGYGEGVQGRIVVELYDSNNNLVTNTNSGSDGKYSFKNLQPGSYKTKFLINGSYTFTNKDFSPYNPNSNSRVNPSTGLTDSINLLYRQKQDFWNAGLKEQKGTIAGKIYSDTNQNGFQDTNEPDYSASNPVPNGTSVNILNQASNLNINNTINPDGTYSVLVVSGTYSVNIAVGSQNSVSLSTENGVGTGSNPTIVSVNAGTVTNVGKDGIYLRPNKATITGKIYSDNNFNGIQDNNEPDYSISNLVPALTEVRVEDYYDANIFYSPTINVDGTYLIDVPSSIYGKYYNVKIVPPSNYVLSQSNETGNGYSSNPTTIFTVTGTSLWAGKDGLLLKTCGCIRGKEYIDLNSDNNSDNNENSVSGGQASLINIGLDGVYGTNDDVFVAYKQVDDTGYYEFTNISNGNYVIKFEDGNVDTTFFTGPTIRYVDITNSTSDISHNFGYNLSEPKGIISGMVYSDISRDGNQNSGTGPSYSYQNPIPLGLSIQIKGVDNTSLIYNPVLNPDGTYNQILTPGTYDITVIPPPNYSVTNSQNNGSGNGFNPTRVNVAAQSQEFGGIDGISALRGTITGSVYLDINDNGIQESYEVGAYGVYNNNILLRDVNNPLIQFVTQLSPDGTYSVQVDYGTYEVLVLENYNGEKLSQSQENGGGSGSNPTIVIVGPGEQKSAGKDGLVFYNPELCTNAIMFANLDFFGPIKTYAEDLPTNCATITGSIYSDLNRNGVQDPSEPNYSSVVPFDAGTGVSLRSITDPNIIISVPINLDGSYSMNVAEDDYDLVVTTGSNFTINQSQENGSGVGSNPTRVTLTRRVTKSAGKDGINNNSVITTPTINTGNLNIVNGPLLVVDTNKKSIPTTISKNETLPKPQIGVNKVNTELVDNNDGSFDAKYIVTIGNVGQTDLQNVYVYDYLSEAFKGANYEIKDIVSPKFEINKNFNGLNDIYFSTTPSTVINMNSLPNPSISDFQSQIQTKNNLAIGESTTILYTIKFTPNDELVFVNAAGAVGYSKDGQRTEDDPPVDLKIPKYNDPLGSGVASFNIPKFKTIRTGGELSMNWIFLVIVIIIFLNTNSKPLKTKTKHQK